MTHSHTIEMPGHDRRRYPRFFVTSRMTLAVEDETLRESIGIGEPGDISLGGLRIRNLPSGPSVKVGDRLGLLLIDQEDAVTLHAEVVHHGTPETFGVEFQNLSAAEQMAVNGVIRRLHSRI